MNKANKPLNDKLDRINEVYNKRMEGLENKIIILESENNIKDEKIETD